MNIPRPEHPRPQFTRPQWLNLNGAWTFTFDPGKSGVARGLSTSQGFERQITVPFCPESVLSGVGHTDFIEAMWYHRTIDIPSDWRDRRILLHFGGVDYESELYVDGVSAGLHFGGSASFEVDISAHVSVGASHDIVLRIFDQTRNANQPGGKQCPDFASRGCHYTRTTGIWQTVWLEAVDVHGLRDVHIVADLDGARFIVAPRFHAQQYGLRWRATLVGQEPVTAAAADGATLVIPVRDPRPWRPDDPHLYEMTFEVLDSDGHSLDQVSSYAGLRKVHVEGSRIFLNNEPLYQRLVLDQGFYPDGIWTAPSDAALKGDIELSMRAGFNGARLHQKVFEERFHHWADRLGYLTWGESSSWGCGPHSDQGARNFLSEWREIVERDRNHPSIIAWTPWNETWGLGDDPRAHHRTHADSYDICKSVDPTRPVNDASGGIHVKTDLWTEHTYEQDAAKLKQLLTPSADGCPWLRDPNRIFSYSGQPYLLDEFGGTKWVAEDPRGDDAGGWGYGEGPRTLEEFYLRLEALVKTVLDLDHCCGYCYTQLTDVEQECNGIFLYNRSEKFDMDRIHAIFSRSPEPA
ncbi:MAG: sugar-binding domain-containing protein [Candidatus Latescibacterota bacterium]|nr:sugar-binding domain-containing protein [Candidatus Latescibacterota bacterium]